MFRGKYSMEKIISKLNNEEGSAIIIALIILVLLTMIGITATDNTVIELQIVRNEAIYRQNFYKAEGSVIELAQIMEVNNISTPASFDWLTDKSTALDMTIVGNWNWNAGGNSQLSNNLNAADATNNTAQAAVSNGITAGSSLSMTGGSNLYSYSIFGLFDSTSGQGRSLILMGYNKRF
jgi:Tfp pilus assembly protein PilX